MKTRRGLSRREWGLTFLVGLTFILKLSNSDKTVLDGSLRSIADGTARQPFVFRQLVPFLSKLLAGWLGVSIEMIAYASIVLCFVIFTLALKNLAASVEINVNVGASLFVLISFFGNVFVYDPAVLALSTCLWLFLARGHKKALLVTYTLACFNKEATLVLALAPKSNKMKGLLIGIWLVVRALLLLLLKPAGAPAKFHLLVHLRFIAIPLGALIWFGMTGGALFLMFAGWKTLPPILKRVALPTLALLGLFVLFGMPMEYRVFYEIYAPAVLMAHCTLRRRKKQPVHLQLDSQIAIWRRRSGRLELNR